MGDELGWDGSVIGTGFVVPERTRLLRDLARRMSERAWFAHEAEMAGARARWLASLPNDGNDGVDGNDGSPSPFVA